MTTAALAFPLPHTGISSMTLQVPNPVAENHDDAWQLIANRDPSADGRIFYAVRTTGIFCRPSCPSRRPCRKNVEFFSDLLSAFEAGYRPCKRCNPAGLRAEAQLVENLCAHLNRDLDRCVKLADLARVAGLSSFTVQRTFQRVLGIAQISIGRINVRLPCAPVWPIPMSASQTPFMTLAIQALRAPMVRIA